MKVLNEKNYRYLTPFYRNLLGNKYSLNYCILCLGKSNAVGKHKGHIVIYEKNTAKELFKTTIIDRVAKCEFLLVFAFLVLNYGGTNLTISDTIGLATPILEDLAQSVGSTYKSSVKLTREQKEYLYADRLREYFGE